MSLLAAVGLLAFFGQDVDLDIENLEPGCLVRHPLIILRGTTPDAEIEAGLSGGNLAKFPALDNHFTACVQLKAGTNKVLVKSGQRSVTLRVDYRPATTTYKVRPVFLTAADEEPTFMGMQGTDVAEVKQRFSMALMLIQAFTAELMREAGYGVQTFALDYDKDGLAEIKFIRSLESGDALRQRDGNNLWSMFYDKLSNQFDYGHEKVIALMGFTRYDAATKKVSGHTALGGGALALFGSGSMRFWPKSVADIPKVFTDITRVKSDEMFDDSAYRSTAWGNAATTLGAMLHEAGHTFGLPHTSDPRCIMSRGFDHINRAFICQEPSNGGFLPTFGEKGVLPSRWDPFFSARLHYHPWFQANSPAVTKFQPPKIVAKDGRIILSSAAGIRVIGVWKDGSPNWFEHYSASPPNEKAFTVAELESHLKTKGLNVYMMDNLGREASLTMPPDDKR